MSLAGALRQAVLRATGEDEIYRAIQVYAVADRNIDWRDTGTGADYPADDLFAVDEVGGAPLLLSGLLVLTDEPALRATNRWHVEKEPEVRREPHASWVSEPLRVEDHRVHLRLDRLQSLDDRWYLPKRQKTRHVRERQGCLEAPHFDYRKLRKREHHDGRVAPVTLRGDVRPGYVPHPRKIQRRPYHNPWRKLPLQPACLAWRESKRVKPTNPHTTTTLRQRGYEKQTITKTAPTDRMWRGEKYTVGRGSLIRTISLPCYIALADMLRFCYDRETLWLRYAVFSAEDKFCLRFCLKLNLCSRAGRYSFSCDCDLYGVVAGGAGGMGSGFVLRLGLPFAVSGPDLKGVITRPCFPVVDVLAPSIGGELGR